MKHDREFWARHVRSWRASGLTQKAYCARRRLAKGSLGCWASTLGRRKGAVTDLVEISKRSGKCLWLSGAANDVVGAEVLG
jgi:hypothetical protein